MRAAPAVLALTSLGALAAQAQAAPLGATRLRAGRARRSSGRCSPTPAAAW